MNQPVCVVEAETNPGESPIWSPNEGVLYWIDIRGRTLHRFDPATAENRSWATPSEIGCVGLAQGGRLICGLRDGFHFFDPASGAFDAFLDPEPDRPHNRLNDGKVDRAGRFWCASMQDPDFQPVGTLYRLDPDGRCAPFEQNITIPNGLAWSPDSRVMYFADSPTRIIWAYDYDIDTGEPANRRIFAEVPDSNGLPDGTTVDAEGFVWNANMFGGRVTRYDPLGGVDRIVELPCLPVSSCGFGGADLGTLYITTGRNRLSEDQLAEQPLAGSLFAFDAGVKGLPEPYFGG